MHLAFDWHLFATTFALIFVAELPDKTAFATLFLATSHKPIAVFLGAAGAFVIQTIVAVAFGSVLNLLPERPVHYGAAVLFFVFAILMWRRDPEEEEDSSDAASSERARFLKSTATAFMAVFIAEWGDLTQLATATLVAKYGEILTIFVAAILALWLVTACGVAIGHATRKFLHPLWTQRIASVALACVGLYMLIKG